MEIGLLIIFWYGILHALGPDHLAVIADFSIGKNIKKSAVITLLFALGHGLMLFVFASLLQSFPVIEAVTHYGDTISAAVILLMGFYLLYMVWSDRIQLTTHIHNGIEHTHINFSRCHQHKLTELAPALSLGILMGIGGVRGMLITLGLVNQQAVSVDMIAVFVLGVMVVFISFGLLIGTINRVYLNSLGNIRRVFSLLGVTSIAVASHMLWL
ncbi:MAG: nickel/cobalt transporter family protein [Thiomicrorhabdus sp.]|nr:MAG: nickel/cobalt transporter family protein [Thiomicrorhabdus sp.]